MSIENGKLFERAGRKAMGLNLLYRYDRQAAYYVKMGSFYKSCSFFCLAEFSHLEVLYLRCTFHHQFQPIRQLSNLQVHGKEALLRHASASPIKIFNIAKQNGFESKLDKISQEEALTTLALTKYKGRRFINCQLETLLNDESLLKRLSEKKEKESIVIEITEGQDFCEHQLKPIKTKITELKNIGVKIAIDDFGSGFANFRMLDHIEPDYIKTDKSLIKNLAQSKNMQNVVKVLGILADNIGASVIAEGIEYEEQREILIDNKIKYGQGWLFDPPIPVASLWRKFEVDLMSEYLADNANEY